MPTPPPDFERVYRSVPRRGLSPAGRRRITSALAEAEYERHEPVHLQRGVTRWQLVAACILVALVTHIMTRWTTSPATSATGVASIEPVAVSMDAIVFPTRHRTRISAWRSGASAPEGE